jgi:hypothetical protein
MPGGGIVGNPKDPDVKDWLVWFFFTNGSALLQWRDTMHGRGSRPHLRHGLFQMNSPTLAALGIGTYPAQVVR